MAHDSITIEIKHESNKFLMYLWLIGERIKFLNKCEIKPRKKPVVTIFTCK